MAQSPILLGRPENTPGYNSHVQLLILLESFEYEVHAFTHFLSTD